MMERNKVRISITIDSDLNDVLSTLNNRSEFVNEEIRRALIRKGKLNSNRSEIVIMPTKGMMQAIETLKTEFHCDSKEEFVEKFLAIALTVSGKNPDNHLLVELANKTMSHMNVISKEIEQNDSGI